MKNEIGTIEEFLKDYDWREVFTYAPDEITQKDVETIHAAVNGERDVSDWVGLFGLKDGRVLLIWAGCDYTGWDCRAGGSGQVFKDLTEAIDPLGVDLVTRDRLGIQ